jgi:hypothetical protein
MNKEALLKRLNQELIYFKAQARKADDADRAQNYSGDWELTVERLESRGRVRGADWIIHVIEEFKEESK